jgi:cell division protein FtsB
MNKLRDIILSVVAGFLITLLLNSFVEYLGRPFGSVAFGSALDIGGNKYYLPLDVANFENEPINGFRIVVPAYVGPSQIITSAPLSISPVTGEVRGPDTKVLVLGGLEPHRITRILLPLSKPSDLQHVRAQNHKKLRLAVQEGENVESPFFKSLGLLLTNALVYAFIIGLSTWYVTSKRKELLEELRESREQLNEERDKLEKSMKELTQKISDVTQSSARIRIILFARISDYAKELRFWRDTVRKILSSSSSGRAVDAELLISEVTATLKTYSTRNIEGANDFEAVKVLAGLLSDMSGAKEVAPNPRLQTGT